MKKYIFGILISLTIVYPLTLNAQWAKTYGGTRDDKAHYIQQTSDGGYIVAGVTESFNSVGKYLWILKLESSGEIEWQKYYKSIYDSDVLESIVAIQQTSDGGYIVGGNTVFRSLVLKLSSNGDIDWQKYFISPWYMRNDKYEFLTSIKQTNDGGYIATGYSYYYYNEYITSEICRSYLLKLSPQGDYRWHRLFTSHSGSFMDWDGKLFDKAISIQETSDGGFIVGGHTNYSSAGGYDYLILKLNSAGEIEWQNTYGGGNDEEFHCIQQTSDGGYIALGWTKSFGAGLTDCWILKLESNGDIEWQCVYGGDRLDGAYSIQQIRGGGYIVVGPTTSFGTGRSDFFMMQLTPTGDIEWYRTCGGIRQDEALSIPQTIDGGFIAAGYTDSFGAGGSDFLIVKLNSQGEIHSSCDLIQSANPLVSETNAEPQPSNLKSNLFNPFRIGPWRFMPYQTGAIINVLCEAPKEYKLHLSKTAGGTTNPLSGTYAFEEGTNLSLTAMPNSGYRFKGWIGDVLLGHENNNPLNIVINSVKYIKANFVRQLKLTIESGLGGTTSPTSGVHTYDQGTKVILTAIPNTHYTFSSWIGDVPLGKANDNPVILTIDSNKTIKPNFLRNIYPPANFQGQKVFNRSLSQAEYLNVLTWKANGNNVNTVKYKIYLVEGENKSLLVELNANTFQYLHRRVEKNMQYRYAIHAVNDENREGDPTYITVQ